MMEKESGVNNVSNPIVAPKDKNNLVFLICCWLGIGMLLPWNFFYSVDGYWKHKFRDPENDTVTTSMQKFWGSNLSIVSMTPNFIFLLLNVIIGHRLPIAPRIYGSIFFNILLFIASLIFTQVNTDSWEKPFYYVTLTSALLFNMNDSIFQGAFAALIGRFPPEYMSSMAQGQAVGGTLASAISVTMLAIGGSDVNGALFSFSFAAIFLSTVVFLLFYASRQEFYKFYSPEEGEESGNVKKVDFTLIIKNTWIFNFALFLNFFVTLGVFPSIPSLAKTTSTSKSWQTYFVPVGCFLLFNICDLVGRLVAGFVKWPTPTKTGSVLTLVLAICRLAFIPLFMFCNVSPEDRTYSQVYFKSDTAYLLINTLFGLTNGYLANICMMSSPKMVEDRRNQSVAASIMVFMLVAGLWAGAACSRLWIKLL